MESMGDSPSATVREFLKATPYSPPQPIIQQGKKDEKQTSPTSTTIVANSVQSTIATPLFGMTPFTTEKEKEKEKETLKPLFATIPTTKEAAEKEKEPEKEKNVEKSTAASLFGTTPITSLPSFGFNSTIPSSSSVATKEEEKKQGTIRNYYQYFLID
jgi:hypothetical protein